jgi:gas vesicle protein
MDTREKLFIFMAHFITKVKKIRFADSIMNQLNKTIIREEIQWLLEAITEQFEAINAYEDKIPQIEFDIIMENIRKLYENLHLLNRGGDSFHYFSPSRAEIPEIKPFSPAGSERNQTAKPDKKQEVRPSVKIKMETESTEALHKDHHKPDKSTSDIDLFSTESNEFSEKLKETREKTYASERVSSQRKELKATISINEKFLFINELFDGNLREYNITIETLNGFSELRQALDFLDLLRVKNLWESESAAFKRLRELVEQKF